MTDRIVSLLERLIRVDTHNPGGNESTLAALLADELAARAPDELRVMHVPRATGMGSYVLARWGTPRLLLNAHIDTVPANAGWTSDPWTPTISQGRVFGLGACDTKGSIAAILQALDQAPARDVVVIFSGDEEHGGTCMQAILSDERAVLASVERAIVCEPTSCRAGTRHRGILALDAHLTGRGGHSSQADTLPAPIADLARVAVAFHAWGVARRNAGPPNFLGMCLNVAKLDGGVAFNVVPEEARLSLSVRPPPGAEMSAIREELSAIAGEIAPGATIDVMIDNPPFSTRDPSGFSAALGVLEPIDLGFWTEASMLVASGIDAVVFGPGDIAQAHAPNEFVPIADLTRSRDVFIEVLKEHAAR